MVESVWVPATHFTTILARVCDAAVITQEVLGLVVAGVPRDTSPLLSVQVAEVMALLAAIQLERLRVIVSASPTCITC